MDIMVLLPRESLEDVQFNFHLKSYLLLAAGNGLLV